MKIYKYWFENISTREWFWIKSDTKPCVDESKYRYKGKGASADDL